MIVGSNRCNRDVADSSEISTIIQMFIFESEEIPHKTPETKYNVTNVLLLFIMNNMTLDIRWRYKTLSGGYKTLGGGYKTLGGGIRH